MRTKQLNGLVNDLSNYEDYRNPLNHIWLEKKFEINLKTGEISYYGEDDISDFYKNKRKWFVDRVRKLGGKLTDFDEAKLIVFGAKEKIVLKYNGKDFDKEVIYNHVGKEIKKAKEDIKKLK